MTLKIYLKFHYTRKIKCKKKFQLSPVKLEKKCLTTISKCLTSTSVRSIKLKTFKKEGFKDKVCRYIKYSHYDYDLWFRKPSAQEMLWWTFYGAWLRKRWKMFTLHLSRFHQVFTGVSMATSYARRKLQYSSLDMTFARIIVMSLKQK